MVHGARQNAEAWPALRQHFGAVLRQWCVSLGRIAPLSHHTTLRRVIRQSRTIGQRKNLLRAWRQVGREELRGCRRAPGRAPPRLVPRGRGRGGARGPPTRGHRRHSPHPVLGHVEIPHREWELQCRMTARPSYRSRSTAACCRSGGRTGTPASCMSATRAPGCSQDPAAPPLRATAHPLQPH